MTHHRRHALKALLLAMTAIAVCALPTLSLSAFLYLCGAIFALVGLLALGAFLDLIELYVGFRAFEARTDELSRRAFGWRRRSFVRLVKQ